MKFLLRKLTGVSLWLKLLIPVAFVLLVAASALVAVVRAQNEQIYQERQDRALRLAEVAYSLTETERGHNRMDVLRNVYQTLKEKGAVDRVRLLGLKGQILLSTDKDEIGQTVDRNSAGCVECHNPANTVTSKGKPYAKFERMKDDGRVLGVAYPLLNKPSCQGKECHPSADDVKALGVVEVELSFQEMDSALSSLNLQIFLASSAVLLGVVVIIGVFMHWGVNRPVKQLLEGTKKVRSGDLAVRIPVTFADEIGRLAESFNEMMADLSEAKRTGQQRSLALEKNIEELKSAQMQLVRSEKLASLGKLSAGVAHEINNPLATVLTYCYLLRRRAPEDDPHRERIETMIREITRCSQIVKGLLDFSREDEPKKKPMDLNAVLAQTLTLVSHQSIFHNIDITTALADDLPRVQGDASQIQQVFMNIIINAAEAMTKGGALSIRTGSNGRFCEALFQDTGPGIEAGSLTRIFDPFFSTKKGGHGTGLGLAVSYSIMERHGGEIEVKSDAGEGTLFTVRLPL